MGTWNRCVAGVFNGRPFQRFAGVRASSGHDPITANTYLPAASLSKPVFAWAVRDLVKQGKLEWAKPLEDYARLGLSGDAKRITAEHVLTHTTGLPNWRFKPGQELVAEFTPGSKWRYSGEGIFLLHRVVEKIVGVPMASYLKDNLLLPLGMTASTFAWTPEIQARATSGHDRRGLPLERSVAFYARQSYDAFEQAGLRPESASVEQILGAYEKAKLPALPVNITPNMAGSLWTTAEDYPKFLKRVLEDISERPDDYRPRIDVNRRIAWTLGWGVDRSFRPPAFFHTGDAPGFKNFAWVQPARKTALVFFHKWRQWDSTVFVGGAQAPNQGSSFLVLDLRKPFRRRVTGSCALDFEQSVSHDEPFERQQLGINPLLTFHSSFRRSRCTPR